MIKKINYSNYKLSLILWFFLLPFVTLWGLGQSTAELRQQLEVREKFNLAISLYHQKSYGLAIPYFIEVLKRDNQHFFGRYYLSLSFFRDGRTDEAIREIENLIRIHGLNRNLEKKINFFSKQKFLEVPTRTFNSYVWIRDYPNPDTQQSSLGGSLNPFALLRKQGYRIRMPIHIEVNQNQELMVLDFSLKKFFRLDGDGIFLDDIYKNFSSSTFKQLSGPWAFSPVEILETPSKKNKGYWITDFLSDNIKVIDSSGKIISVIGTKGIGETNFLGIKDIATDENGNFFIVDSGNGRIQYRNQRGEWLKNIGQRGDSSGYLLNPIDIAYEKTQRQIYVLDKGNKKIVIFSIEGTFIQELPINTINSRYNGRVNNPQKLYWGNPEKPKYLYLLDAKSLHRFHLIDQIWEEIELKRQGVNQFISIAMGEDGYLYLGNALREKVEVFAPVEKTYVNLPVLIKSIDIQKFPLVNLEVEANDLVGYPIKFLQSQNFSLYENNTALPFKLLPNPNTQRIVLLVEKSTAAQERDFTIKAFIENLYNQLNGDEGIKVITYNRNGYIDQTPFANFKLTAIEKIFNPHDAFTQEFIVDGALRLAINHTKEKRFKQAIVMLVFTPYQAAHFQNQYFNIVQTLKNNDIPVYIFYAGQNFSESSLFYLRSLSSQTRGKFYTYNEEALQRFENDFSNYHNGNYTLQYLTSSDPRNRGVFRRVAIDVRYKNSQGEDSLAGYPLP